MTWYELRRVRPGRTHSGCDPKTATTASLGAGDKYTYKQVLDSSLPVCPAERPGAQWLKLIVQCVPETVGKGGRPERKASPCGSHIR
jgi:hypothetical protein